MIRVIASPYGAWWKWEYNGKVHYARPQEIVEIEEWEHGGGTAIRVRGGPWLDVAAPISEVVKLLGIEG